MPKQVLIQINHITSYMTSQTKLTKDLIFKMVPQVTTKFNGRSKRALLLFVGNIASNLYALVFHKHDSNNLLQNLYLNVFEK
jgi:hypothetical protein